ncbi:hypothetical protein GQ53DRAFT_358246 [Thozetella sp. PMI_491]|nr:hypothetical protein GQ53DRAFT_358246 [Thozetella sp. PMI_491]
MLDTRILAVALGVTSLAAAQSMSWCKDEKCGDCPSGITSAGTGYPQCVVYDTETVFGGQGFEPATGNELLYKVFGNFPDACGDQSGAFVIRSPASLTTNGCGDLIFSTNVAKCSNALTLAKTFMVQFCCGEGDCSALHVPYARGVAGHTDRRGAGGLQGAYLEFANGTRIEPVAVGSPPELKPKVKRCDGYKDGSYTANGEPYLTTKDTQIVSASFPAQDTDRTITLHYDQTVETSTTFDTSIGDPFGIVSVSVGFEFSESHTNGVQYELPVPAGVAGRAGFTPVYRCTKGKITDCDGKVGDEHEACTPYVESGIVQGDYLVVQN